MSGLTVKDTKDKIIFTIDKSTFTEATLIEMIQIARVEYLIKKASFDEKILSFGEELKESLWQENKKEFLQGLDL